MSKNKKLQQSTYQELRFNEIETLTIRRRANGFTVDIQEWEESRDIVVEQGDSQLYKELVKLFHTTDNKLKELYEMW
jgi:hypothetical protein